MNNNTAFHGSDLEKISTHYNIEQNTIINFAANVNPLGISATLRDALRDKIDIISSYPDRDYVSLRQALGSYCHTNPDNMIVGNGSTELISLLISNIQAKKSLLLGPTYSEYEKELALIGCTLEEYLLTPDNDFALDMPSLFAKLGEGFDFLILCNPNNPTGTALDTTQLETIFQYCTKHNIFVMIDETYIEFSSDIEKFSAIGLTEVYDNVMVLRGVSKFFAAPGLRMGYGITSNQELLKYLKKHQNPWSLNSIATLAGEIMFTDDAYITMTQQLIHTEKEKFYSALAHNPNYKFYKTEANFMLVKILNPAMDATQFFELCIRQGLMIRNCDSFFHGDGNYIRFCFMKPEDNDKLITCFN